MHRGSVTEYDSSHFTRPNIKVSFRSRNLITSRLGLVSTDEGLGLGLVSDRLANVSVSSRSRELTSRSRLGLPNIGLEPIPGRRRRYVDVAHDSRSAAVDPLCTEETGSVQEPIPAGRRTAQSLSLIHISEPTRRTPISYAVFCLKK